LPKTPVFEIYPVIARGWTGVKVMTKSKGESKSVSYLSVSTPAAIQAYLDGIPYSADDFYRCPKRVAADGKAHCFDGAVFSASALRRIGHPPLIVDMRAQNDDDHVISIFKVRGHYGAVAKSNFVGLRYREPIFRSLRELILSYFEVFYNTMGEKTLRSYSVPVDLSRFDRFDWESDDTGMEPVALALDSARHIPVLTPAMIRGLQPVDKRSLDAGLMGSNPDGLFLPE
jgi:hypothetical protein